MSRSLDRDARELLAVLARPGRIPIAAVDHLAARHPAVRRAVAAAGPVGTALGLHLLVRSGLVLVRAWEHGGGERYRLPTGAVVVDVRVATDDLDAALAEVEEVIDLHRPVGLLVLPRVRRASLLDHLAAAWRRFNWKPQK